MTDTIGLYIPITDQEQHKIMLKSKGTQRKDFKNNIIEFTYVNGEVFAGSFEHKVQLKAYDNKLRIEFSIPKIVFGHNIYLIDDKQLVYGVNLVRSAINKEYDVNLPSINLWELYRLDICYAWKFDNPKQLDKALTTLKSLEYLDFSKYVKKTSVMWVGGNYSMKFYAKNPEFIKHDLKILIQNRKIDEVKKLLKLSENVLRFEVTFRKKQLQYMYGNLLHLPFFIKLDKISLLNQYTSKMIKVWKNFQGIYNIQNLLLEKYSKTKAMQLYSFFTTYYDENPLKRAFLIKNYNPSTIWRNLKDLKLAGVGLPTEEEEEKLFPDISIPSKDCINNF